jgi:pyruvate formate lyase activating enzyme
MFGEWEIFKAISTTHGSFYCRFKISNNAAHREYTHQSNEVIRRNYSILAHLGVALLTRIPLIPGITDTEFNITAIAEFMKNENPGGQVELINFNPLAINKYALMNKSTEFFDGMAPLPPIKVEALQNILENHGLSVIKEHKRSNDGGN